MNFYQSISNIREYLTERSKEQPSEYVFSLLENCNRMLHELETRDDILAIDKEEATNLLNFFLSTGWISYEHHMPIHDFYKRLKLFVEGK